jgi:hypothetical protein
LGQIMIGADHDWGEFWLGRMAMRPCHVV